jgi:hypothetical protein
LPNEVKTGSSASRIEENGKRSLRRLLPLKEVQRLKKIYIYILTEDRGCVPGTNMRPFSSVTSRPVLGLIQIEQW